MKKFSRILPSIVLLLLPASGFYLAAMGEDPKAQAKKICQQGDEAWARRGNLKDVNQAIAFYEQALKLDPRGTETWVKLAEANYWLGEILPPEQKEKRLVAYDTCFAAAKKALALDINSPGANLWVTVCNGRKTELLGLLSGNFDLGLAIICLNRVAKYQNDYYYGAIFRYWGRFVYEIPEVGRKLVHFSLEDSVVLYQESLAVAPNFFLTRLYLAESYLALGKRALAKKELQFIVNTPPGILPSAEPENRFYQAQARQLLRKEFP